MLPSDAEILAMKRLCVVFGRTVVDTIKDPETRETCRADLAITMRVIRTLEEQNARSPKHGPSCGCSDCT